MVWTEITEEEGIEAIEEEVGMMTAVVVGIKVEEVVDIEEEAGEITEGEDSHFTVCKEKY